MRSVRQVQPVLQALAPTLELSMTIFQQTSLRRRLEAVPRDELADIVLNVIGRIGGAGALTAAIAEAETARSARQARRRHDTAARLEMRA